MKKIKTNEVRIIKYREVYFLQAGFIIKKLLPFSKDEKIWKFINHGTGELRNTSIEQAFAYKTIYGFSKLDDAQNYIDNTIKKSQKEHTYKVVKTIDLNNVS